VDGFSVLEVHVALSNQKHVLMPGVRFPSSHPHCRIPGILQGRNVFDDVLLDVPLTPLRRAQEAGLLVVQARCKVKFCGPLFTLRIKNDNEELVPFSTVRALPVNILIHPVTEAVVNVSFVLAPVDEKVRVRVPLRILNAEKCPGLRLGGWINMIHRAVDINVVPGVAPPLFVTVDIGGMQVKDKKLFKDLEFVGKGSGCTTVLSGDDLALVLSKV
jgi:Ribosomal protein TL5, C-terminal domain